ncbi:hypothetical protein CJD_A0024 [Clostridium perfringens D str. JGS1721]|uniref:Uncharacterized protein n=1 Tax=Clostridium perfringens D str. JGS1721 TaxID=488537 RepID=B1V869_CLOPF|nr:hypothetical protein CJD_A0177 [Clostridium perfringens D str. JGS1721]EDT69991.1 hypothetical protein CJD_A0024 [Clostridium perfringens D str. JGS1721]
MLRQLISLLLIKNSSLPIASRGYYFFCIFSISKTIKVNNASRNIPPVNNNIKLSLLICTTPSLKKGKVIPVARTTLILIYFTIFYYSIVGNEYFIIV